jgi:hypothetical protein
MTDPIHNIQAPKSTGEVGQTGKAPGTEGSPQFRRLLDSLEEVVRQQTSSEDEAITDPAALEDALQRADDGFKKVMDLRKSLEEAFQRRMA